MGENNIVYRFQNILTMKWTIICMVRIKHKKTFTYLLLPNIIIILYTIIVQFFVMSANVLGARVSYYFKSFD